MSASSKPASWGAFYEQQRKIAHCVGGGSSPHLVRSIENPLPKVRQQTLHRHCMSSAFRF